MTITGTFMDSAAEPREGLEVMFSLLKKAYALSSNLYTSPPSSVTTNEDGQFLIELSPGDYLVEFDIDELTITVPATGGPNFNITNIIKQEAT